jgi:glycosyltransferase involved in cell wall biosynthesis
VARAGRAPLVSIGLPVYNGERFLAESLDSLLAQTHRNLEIIVCDNASTDGTEEIVREHAARDRRVRYVRSERNRGVAANFNRAFHVARGPFFKWATCDDWCAPDLVERCLRALEEHPEAVLAYCATRLIDASGNAIGDYDDRLHLPWPEPSRRFAAALTVGRCNVFYGVLRTSIVRRTRLFGRYVGSDLVFIPELALYGTFLEVPERLFHRRLHDGACSSKVNADRLQESYDPGATRASRLREWRRLFEHLRSLLRAPASARERMRLLAALGRHARWRRGRLGRELLGLLPARRH